MNHSRLKVWCIITFTMAVIAIVIRAIWQIVVIPTSGTMLIFIPLIVALIGADALFAYLVVKPEKLKALPFSVGSTAALTAGLLAGVTHFVRFIISTQADHFLCKVIGFLVLLASVSAYFILIYVIWSLRKARDNGQRKV
ncbi:MAG TPA: hypothetical protein VMW86_01785 [Dehalococcoidales bacterium]|nr:hypothetical protein [Dehalococcoidales bacterium]